jgi:hypothetical protein
MQRFRIPVPWEPRVLLQLTGTQPEALTCTLRGLFKGTLHVVCTQPIPQVADLTVRFGEVMIAGKVSYCSAKDDQYLVCVLVSSAIPPPGTKRRDPRLPLKRTCSLTVLSRRSMKLKAAITDISASGMGFQMDELLEDGTMICVETEDFVAAGQVLHCRDLGTGQYAAGMEVTDFIFAEDDEPSSERGRECNWFKRAWENITSRAD